MNTVPTSRRSIIVELIVATCTVIVVAHALFRLRTLSPFINGYLAVLVAALLLYVPVIALWLRHRPIDFMDRTVSATARACLIFAVAALVVFPAFFLIAHFWQLYVMHLKGFQAPPFPSIGNVILYQLVIVALPEEFFFRGYMQSALNAVFPRRRRFLGADLGAAWIVTALVFAIAHSLIVYRWWHFAIFFPALVFGYLRERTGSITAPVLFHAASNILMNWFARGYY